MSDVRARVGVSLASLRRGVLLAALFVTSLALIITMALISQYDAHPDEQFHLTTADYYLHWWTPPAAGDPRILPSLSGYGFSYHYNLTPVYFLAGRAVAPIQHLIEHPFLALRLLNVGLFGALVLLALRRRDETFALCLLLCPAQLWYVFSCFNDDAFALFLSLLCCWQVMCPETAFARFLASDGWRAGRHGALLFALMLALILLSKANYHVFLAFLGFHALWMIAHGDRRHIRRLALKWSAVALAAACLAWPRGALDDWVNDPATPSNRGLTKWQRISEVSDAYAPTGFRPSQVGTNASFPNLQLKSRGVPFREVFDTRWVTTTFQSFIGVYGYMTIYSGRLFYLVSFIAYASFLLTLIVLVWRRGAREDRLYGLACLLAAAGLVLASAHHSWTVDYQPQGRYLFPGVGILFIAILKLRALIPTPILWRYGVLLWLLSCYSFIVTGLRLIPKLGS